MNHFLQVFGKKIPLTEEQAAELKERFAPPERALAEIPAGGTFMIGGHEFVVLEQLDGATAVIRRDLLPEAAVFGSSNCFDGSKVDAICKEFEAELAAIVGADNLVEHTVDLTSDDGLKDCGYVERNVSLLTAEQYRRYVEILDQYPVGNWWWLSTPYSTEKHGNKTWVKCVSPSGVLYGNCCDDVNLGVRPFLLFVSSIFDAGEE